MRHRSRRDKSRRLQVQVAEAFARAFKLMVLAEKPTKPGTRNGVLWVPEGEPADLKVRMMGQAGADVALLTARARDAISWCGLPLWIECKNVEGGWDLGKAFWEGKVPSGLKDAWNQANKGAKATFRPLVVVARNFWPPIAVADWLEESIFPGKLHGPYVMFKGGLSAVPFETVVERMCGKR